MPDRRIFVGLKNYIILGTPYILVMMLDYWGWELGSLLCGYISINV